MMATKGYAARYWSVDNFLLCQSISLVPRSPFALYQSLFGE